MKIRVLIFALIICLICTQAFLCNADDLDWPRWRGPNGDGISMETNWNPEALAEGPKILWKADIGLGHSNVAIKGKYLYTMGYKSGTAEDTVYCLKVKNGKKVWEDSYDTNLIGIVTQSTPVIDEDYVYTLSVSGDLFCFKAATGKVQWKKNIVEELQAERPNYWFATSPVVDGHMLILNINEYGAALDKKTGETIWTSPPTNEKYVSQYSTPIFYDLNGERYAIIFGNYLIHAVELERGKPIWSMKWEGGLSTECATDPIYSDGRVFITTYDDGCALIDIHTDNPQIIWKNKNIRSEISSSVLVKGYIYGMDGKTDYPPHSLRCIDWKTGELMWEHKMRMGTLIAAGDKLIILEYDGTLHIAEATPLIYKEISVVKVDEGACQFWTPPVLYKGKIFCRNHSHNLICIDVSK